MIKLNRKSALGIEEINESTHQREIEEIVSIVSDIENYDVALLVDYLDPANAEKEQKIHVSELHDISRFAEYADCKNGIDFEINDNNLLIIKAYGQGYTLNDEYHVVETQITIVPVDDEKNFIDISSYFDRYLIDLRFENEHYQSMS